MSGMIYWCLKCGKQFQNFKNIAVCDECLAKFEEAFKNGCSSGYVTVDMYLYKKYGEKNEN